jgi:regulator of protease activity HflC (stomatin/prohibitin superfamily)
MNVNKFASLLFIAGFLTMSANKLFYLVNPGEKALVMNNLSGLKTKVFNQGWNILIPFIEVFTLLN